MGRVFEFLKKHHPFFWAGLILSFGFIAMAIWWQISPGNTLPGFYHYKAATYGDGIGLTLLVFGCARYVQLAREENSLWKEKKVFQRFSLKSFINVFSYLALAIGGLVGLIWQASWLLGVPENWTIIKRKTPVDFGTYEITMQFRGPGVWHAVFFIGAFAIISFFFIRFILAHAFSSQESRATTRSSILLLLISFSGCFYVALIASDNIQKSIPRSILIPVVCCGVVGFLSIIVIIPSFCKTRAVWLKELLSILSGCIIAIAASGTILGDLSGYNWFSLVCCIIASLAYVWLIYNDSSSDNCISKSQTIWRSVFTVLIPILISHICLLHPLSGETVFWIILLFFWSFIVANAYSEEFTTYYRWKGKDKRKFEPALIYLLFVVTLLIAYIIISTLINPSDFSGIYKAIIEHLDYPIVAIGIWVAEKMFEPIKNLDDIVKISSRDRKMKLVQYIKVLIIPFSCFIRLIAESWNNMVGIKNSSWLRFTIVTFISIFLPILFFYILKAFPRSKSKERTYGFLFLSYLSLSLTSLWLSGILSWDSLRDKIEYYGESCDSTGTRITMLILLLSMFAQVIGTSFMVRLTFYSNTYSIRGYSEKESQNLAKGAKTSAILILLGNLFVTFIVCLALPSSSPGRIDIPLLINYTVVLLSVYVVVPVLAHFLIREDLPAYSLEIVNGTPWMEIGKDGIMAFFIFVLASGYPLFMVFHLNEDKAAFGEIFWYSIFGMLAMYKALTFCCANNKEHFEVLCRRTIILDSDLPQMEGANDIKEQYIVVASADREDYETIETRKAQMMNSLFYHLDGQCLFSFIACLVYSFFFALFEICKNVLNAHDEGVLDAWKQYKNHYFPDKSLIQNTITDVNNKNSDI